MRSAFDAAEVETPAARRVTELTLGSFALLLIFFGLVLLCGFCFGLGYSMGHRGPQGLAAASVLPGGAPATVHAETAPPQSALDSQSSTPAQASTSDPAQPSAPAAAIQVSPAPVSQSLPAAQSPAAQVAQSPQHSAVPAIETAPPVAKPAAAAAQAKRSPKGALEESAPAAAAGPIMVQIAAVAQQEDAEVLMGALRKRGYEVVSGREAGDGLVHVRIGPFTTKDEAETWRQKLLNDGYNAIVQP
jgi:DedD protein